MAVLQSIPVEILDRVIGLLYPHVEVDPLCQVDSPLEPLSNARLVCRQWNSLATAHLFRIINLVHNEEGYFQNWNEMLDSDSVKNSARRVVFNSAPEDLYEGRDYQTWKKWSHDGEYPAFIKAVSRLKELKNVQVVELRFSNQCRGEAETDSFYFDNVEEISTRRHTLYAVFEAIQEYNAQRSAANRITSLTIENLQNIPLVEFTTSELFKNVTKHLTTLELEIAEECREHGPDHDLYCIERQTFEPYLQAHWLTGLSDHLTTLTLYFNECWGVLPGYFDGKGLQFKQLKTLNLGNFVIAHHGHFDWVLAQTTLETLRLDSCYIATHLRSYERDQLERWNVRKHDWIEIDAASYGFNPARDVVYTFSGLWETVFDNIRKSLPNLRAFGFCNRADHNYSTSFRSPGSKETRLSTYRYVTFDQGLLPSPWIEPRRDDGEIDFGYVHKGVTSINPAEDHHEGDSRAFEELLSVARARQ